MISEELRKAYTDTTFKVFQPAIDIKIGLTNEVLDTLLSNNNCTEWAYITAFNPYSKILPPEHNLRRHEKLRDHLQHFRFFEGEGVGESKEVNAGVESNWLPEKSFLILGISKSDAAKIGILFEQNAIVIGEIMKPAELLMLV